jgi:hypothetical protein
MTALLKEVIEAHGGMDRWNKHEKVEVALVVGGGFFPFKGIPNDTETRVQTVWLHRPRVTISNFGAADQTAVYTPERVSIEKLNGSVLAERSSPSDAFAGHQMSTPWDPLHGAYFSGEAFRTYLTVPFLFMEEGVKVEEIEPWREGAETWRVLRARFPHTIQTHSAVQDFFFGEDLMLRRHDYNVNVAGGFAAAQRASEYVTANGFRLPTKRRAHTRTPDRKLITEMLMISLDIRNVRFT